MDKKNTLIGVLLLVAAFGALYLGNRYAPPRPPPTHAPAVAPTPPPAQPGVSTGAAPSGTAPVAPFAPTVSGNGLYALPATDAELQAVVSIGNEFIDVAFTEAGGAIRDVALRKYPAAKNTPQPYIFNQTRIAPMLAFLGHPGLDAGAAWKLVERTERRVIFRIVADGKLEVTRTFALPEPGAPGDPYRIQVSTTLRNLSAEPIGAQAATLHLGTATLVDAHDTGLYLNVGSWDGEDMRYIARSDLEGAGFFGKLFGGDPAPKPFVAKPAKTLWGSVKNGFFTSIWTPDQPGTGILVRRVKVRPELPDASLVAFGIAGDFLFELPRLEPGAAATLEAKFYVGPKEYSRLKGFAQREEKAMQFDGYFFNKIFFAGFFAPLLLTVLTWFHGLIPNWGAAIIITTLVMKAATLPLTLSAAKSAKRMSKIQPRLKEINEKFADNPQKKQKATLELFKQAKVNPLGGCLPILVTMPFFIGFFAMLQTSSELRFAEFLWIKDLASPDTVARLFGVPINIMPILMGISSIVQMHLTPVPSVDNAQAKMMKFMPYMFVLFCYNFGSGLALYWTISNIFTIGQQLIINRLPDHDPLAPVAAGVKNVTPSGKKPKKH